MVAVPPTAKQAQKMKDIMTLHYTADILECQAKGISTRRARLANAFVVHWLRSLAEKWRAG